MLSLRALVSVLAVGALSCASGSPPETRKDTSRVEPFLAAPPDAPFDGRLRIAAIFPTTGRYALSGLQSLNGARLAVEDANATGGVHGRAVDLLEYRTGSYFVDAAQAAELAEGPGAVLAIVGANASSLSLAIAQVAEAQGIVQVSNVSTTPDLTWDPATGRERPYVFRVCTSDIVMGARLAELARDDLGARRVAVLYEIGREYSAKLARSFMDNFDDPAAGRITSEFFYLSLETDFETPLRRAAAFEPDAIFVPGSFSDATLIAMHARRLGLKATLLGGDGWSNTRLFGPEGHDRPSYYIDHCYPPEDFLDRYEHTYGERADGCRAILAYDAVRAILGSLESLGPVPDEALAGRLRDTRERLRAALATTSFSGATGPILFDSHGDRQRGVAVLFDPPGPEPARFHRYLGP
jgi:branched-chain amino acid transport system substrate-binding protein